MTKFSLISDFSSQIYVKKKAKFLTYFHDKYKGFNIKNLLKN